ncbi:hypothetical protein C7Y47_23910 [Lysinibacillus sphaericus]|uniref:Uncharacterized protein n=1 Tax=Lysinibacillus sphaericus TaxID=1421 RepID=A0A544U7H0_LYSSH|nr:hypothetical protein [Lysinibacillus sp. SDF0037]TQR26968.1 hypothetical protein C7Y47_23910 [Lysinibacillus sp. SDF0037]
MPEIQLPTKATQDVIKANVDNVNSNVTTVKSNVATVDANVKTVNTNLGIPTSSASSSTSGSAHAKLNYLMNNIAPMTVLKQYPSSASNQSIIDKIAGIHSSTVDAGGTTYLNISGKGRLISVSPSSSAADLTYITIDGNKIFRVNNMGGWLDLSFSTSLKITSDYEPRIVLYELIS